MYDLEKDTVYSFFAEESEIRPNRHRNQGQRQERGRIGDLDGQTSFIASHSPKENKHGRHGVAEASRFDQKDIEEEDVLAKTKTQLKNERKVNKEQADKLK